MVTSLSLNSSRLPQSSSAIDLSICSPDIFLDMQWNTLDYLRWSDHYPISISCGSTETSSAIPSWKRRKSDWPSFCNEASEQLGCSNPGISLDEFSDKLVTIVKNNIPKRKVSVRKRNTVWFTDTCKEAINKRKKALRKVKYSPTYENTSIWQPCSRRHRNFENRVIYFKAL